MTFLPWPPPKSIVTRIGTLVVVIAASSQSGTLSAAATPSPVIVADWLSTSRPTQVGASGSSQSGMFTSCRFLLIVTPLLVNPQGAAQTVGVASSPSSTSILPNLAVT